MAWFRGLSLVALVVGGCTPEPTGKPTSDDKGTNDSSDDGEPGSDDNGSDSGADGGVGDPPFDCEWSERACWERDGASLCFSCTTLATGAPDYDRSFVVDMDGDGFLDVVSTVDGVDWWRGSETGLTAPVILDTVGALHAVVDVDEDGVLDLVGRRSEGTEALMLLSDGAGRPQRKQTFPLGELFSGWSGIGVGDIDGDGHQDLAGLAGDGRGIEFMTIWLGRGDGTFGDPQVTDLGDIFLNAPASIDLVDIDRDGAAEILTWGGWAWRGELGGSGQFGEPFHAEVAEGRRWFTVADDQLLVLNRFEGGDYAPEEIAVDVLHGTEDATFELVARWVFPGGSPRDGVVGDLDGDGSMDAIMSVGPAYEDSNPEPMGVVVAWGNPSGTIGPELHGNTEASLVGARVRSVAELTGDDLPDLLLWFRGELILLEQQPGG